MPWPIGTLVLLFTLFTGLWFSQISLGISGLTLWAVGPLLGIMWITWLSFGFGLLGAALGLASPVTFGASAALGSTALILLIWKRSMPSLHLLKLSRAEFFWSLALLAISIALMAGTFHLHNGHLIIGEFVFSDFASHLPLIRSFSMGENLPPEAALFGGERIRYHFMFYFFAGILERFGLPIDWAMNVPSVIGLTSLLIGIGELGRRMIPKSSRRSVAFLTVFLFLTSSSLAFLRGFHPLSMTSFKAVWMQTLGRTAFLSGGPYYNWDDHLTGLFWTLSIFTNQRHFGFGIAVSLWVLVLWLREEQTSEPMPLSRVLTLGALLGLLPFFHGLSFTSFALLMGVFWLISSKKFPLAIMLITAAILSMPQLQYLAPKSEAAKPAFLFGYGLNYTLGITQGLWAKAWLILIYWWKNLGIKLILWPLGFWALRGWGRGVYFFSTVLFLLPNFVRFGPDIYTNHKFFNIWLIFLNVGCAAILLRLWKRPIGKIVAIPLGVALSLSGLLDIPPIFNNNTVDIADWRDDPIAEFVARETSPHDRFATSYGIYNPVSLAGREILLGWPYFSWGPGYRVDERESQVKRIFESSNAKERCDLLNKLGAKYIVAGAIPSRSEPYKPDLDLLARELRIVKRDDRYIVFEANESCLRSK